MDKSYSINMKLHIECTLFPCGSSWATRDVEFKDHPTWKIFLESIGFTADTDIIGASSMIRPNKGDKIIPNMPFYVGHFMKPFCVVTLLSN